MKAVVTFAEAQERAERWINADVPGYQRRDVRVREFDLGFVAWGEDREDGPTSEGARTRLVLARDSGDATLWPGLPVDEVIHRFVQEYGTSAPAPAAPPPQRVDLEATSFLLTPPEWLQEAADRIGIPDGRRTGDEPAAPQPQYGDSHAADGSGSWPHAGGHSGDSTSPWDATDTSSTGQGLAQGPPATVFAPPLSGSDDEGTPPPAADGDKTPTAFLAGRGAPQKTSTTPAADSDDEPATAGSRGGPLPSTPGTPPPPPAPAPAPAPAPGIADFDTGRRGSPPRGASVPPPPGPPPAPGSGGSGAGGYVPTQMVSADDISSQAGTSRSNDENRDTPSGTGGDSDGIHHAATMLAAPAP
ncbi:hypothetical protein N566_20035, partial [Streptomycetaceae bacterium MP113-05]